MRSKESFSGKAFELTDHLGNVLVTISDHKTYANGHYNAVVISAQDYYPFGMVMPNANNVTAPEGYRFGFNGMEKDDEFTGSSSHYDFGARIYDSRLGRWLSVDRKQYKYPSLSPYHFGYNSPIITIDGDGYENIVISLAESTKKPFEYMFIETAIKQLKEYVQNQKNEETTWIVMGANYSKKEVKKFKDVADELGVKLVVINKESQLIRYLNKKRTDKPKEDETGATSKERLEDKITDISVFGHGDAEGSLMLGLGTDTDGEYKFKIEDVNKLNPDAFDKPNINLYSCNAATPAGYFYGEQNKDKNFTERTVDDWQNSLASKLSLHVKGDVMAYFGKSDYSKINAGEGFADKVNRSVNGFNTNGSQSLPVGGDIGTYNYYVKDVNGNKVPSKKVTVKSSGLNSGSPKSNATSDPKKSNGK